MSDITSLPLRHLPEPRTTLRRIKPITWLPQIERDGDKTCVVYRDKASSKERTLATKLIIGANVARFKIAKAEMPGGDKIFCVFAYHEIIKAPVLSENYDHLFCDVIYDGAISPALTAGYSRAVNPPVLVWAQASTSRMPART